jgi:hypothetical protein
LAELLRDVSIFADLPNERSECLALLRQGTIEQYATGETVANSGDLLAVCAGCVSMRAVHKTWPSGWIVPTLNAAEPASGHLAADRPSVIYRLAAAHAAELEALCPRVAAERHRQLSASKTRNYPPSAAERNQQ